MFSRCEMSAANDLTMENKQGTVRKVSKPLMEKRRRARINHCLSQLKGLLVDRTRTESPKHSKLEKADILELTVRHLHEMKRHHRTTHLVNDPNLRRKFQVGFEECSREVDLFLSSVEDGMGPDVKRGLKMHLLRRLKDINNMELTSAWVEDVSSSDSSFESDLQSPSHSSFDEAASSTNAQDIRKFNLDELSLIPKRLPNGDLALVLPPQALASGSVSCPLSAFRIVCSAYPLPEGSSPPSYKVGDHGGHALDWSQSTPCSSTMSDLSGDEAQVDDNTVMNAQNSDSNFVWRPW